MNMEPQKRAIEAKFTRFSAAYAQVGPGIFPYFGRRLAEYARIPPGARVLDVACGRGAVLFPALEMAGPGGEGIGVDLSAGMISETQREIVRRGIPNARVQQMDAEHLLFADGEFDVLLCAFALFFFPHLDLALAEFRRVLKPGGQLVVSTWTPMKDKRWQWLRPLAGNYLPEEEAGALNASPDWSTPSGLAAILATAGFRTVRAETLPHEFIYRDETDWWTTGWSTGQFEEMQTFSGPDGVERFKAEAFARMQTIKTPTGLPQCIEAVFAAGINP